MTKLNRQLYSRTPAVVVYDNRRLAVREIEYCRHPDSINQTDERITRHHYHARGYLVHSIDARLYEAQHSDPTIQPNLQQILSLGGAFSFSQHIDKGNNVNISDIENKISLNINAMKLVTEYQYTKPELVSQLIAIIEHTANSHPVLKEHFIWGMADSKNIANNAVGKCIRHEDLAGRTEYDGYTLTGKNINELRIITANAVKMNENSLNTQELSFKTSNFYDATGNLLRQIDASNHQREWDYDRAGFLKQSRVILHGTNKFFVIKAISYSAAGQKLRVEQGNGLVTTYEYETETQRLLHVKTQRPQGHALGMRVIQDLRYEYDPVGNVICLKNDAEATRYWRNQKVVPENRYVYDSLYQLVSATGRELTNQHTPASIQSQTITTLVKDAQSYTNYTRLYTYDRSGNLIKIRHNSLLAQQSFTQNICVSLRSNRALLENQHTVIGNIDEHFDAMGNQQQLSTEDLLQWDNRGTLAQVKSNNGNVEHYTYANQSQRLIKQQVRHLSGHYITSETYYLPNMEIWQSKRGAQVIEQREVLILMDNVRALLWKIGLPHGIKNNQLRYSYNDGMGNSGLETDGQGQLVSYEEYYPYGGTAIWSSENTVEANYKTIRYSGKERDSTGLYYYGYRYYQPWVGRWLSADPAGTVDGLNLYRMVRNNPVTLRDPDGRMPNKLDLKKFSMFNQASSSHGSSFPTPINPPVNLNKSLVEPLKVTTQEIKASSLENKINHLNISATISTILPKDTNSVVEEATSIVVSDDVNKLTENHKAAIRRYTGGKYRLYNEKLRIGKMANNIKSSIAEVVDALNILPNYSGTVYRGAAMNKELNTGLKVNDVIYDPAFLSTSLDKNASEKFANSAATGVNDIRYFMSLEVQRGKALDSKELSEFADTEKEVLMLPSTQFQISKLEVKRGVSYISAKELENKVENSISIYKR
ncbi:TPA: hypothetical protein QHL53_000977 [Proteus mirabilis]|nr:hypothetical protein [Proteus mirabilis]